MPELERYMLHLTAQLDQAAPGGRGVRLPDLHAADRRLREQRSVGLLLRHPQGRPVLRGERADGLPDRQAAPISQHARPAVHALVRWSRRCLSSRARRCGGRASPMPGQCICSNGRISKPWPNPASLRSISRWAALRQLRAQVTETIEPLRRDKVIGSSLQAEVRLGDLAPVPAGFGAAELAELFISSDVVVTTAHDAVQAARTQNGKCGRCWRHLPEVKADGSLCGRCEGVLHA